MGHGLRGPPQAHQPSRLGVGTDISQIIRQLQMKQFPQIGDNRWMNRFPNHPGKVQPMRPPKSPLEQPTRGSLWRY